MLEPASGGAVRSLGPTPCGYISSEGDGSLLSFVAFLVCQQLGDNTAICHFTQRQPFWGGRSGDTYAWCI
jgi:hypothetical protein